MARHFLKAWLIGLAIALVSVGFTELAHTPLALVGMILSIPMLPALLAFTEITRRMALSDLAMSIGEPASLVVFGSVVYGAVALLILRLRERRKAKSRRQKQSL